MMPLVVSRRLLHLRLQPTDDCTNEILAGLGQMYVCDERFKNNIDKNGEGTAEFVTEAIKIYCKK